MQALPDLVDSLESSRYKDYYHQHIQRGMYPAEGVFAAYALLALAPGNRSRGEREEAARHILQISLENLPQDSSGKIFAEQIKNRFPLGILRENLEIEEMILVANIASALSASSLSPLASQAEEIISKHQQELCCWSTVSGKSPAQPIVIEEGLFWLYYMEQNLRGVCINSLPGKGQGLPVVFVSAQDERESILRIACHEMIHSAQTSDAGEEIEGWNMAAKRALLEALTEGLALCRIGDRNAFSASEISQRDYAHFVVALFSEMRSGGVSDSDFAGWLEEMNSKNLSRAADFLVAPDLFMRKAKLAELSLVIQYAHSKSSESKHSWSRACEFSNITLPLHIVEDIIAAQVKS